MAAVSVVAEGWAHVASPAQRTNPPPRYVVLTEDSRLCCFPAKPLGRNNALPATPGPGVETIFQSGPGGPRDSLQRAESREVLSGGSSPSVSPYGSLKNLLSPDSLHSPSFPHSPVFSKRTASPGLQPLPAGHPQTMPRSSTEILAATREGSFTRTPSATSPSYAPSQSASNLRAGPWSPSSRPPSSLGGALSANARVPFEGIPQLSSVEQSPKRRGPDMLLSPPASPGKTSAERPLPPVRPTGASEVVTFASGTEVIPLAGNRISVQHRGSGAAVALTTLTPTDHASWVRALRRVVLGRSASGTPPFSPKDAGLPKSPLRRPDPLLSLADFELLSCVGSGKFGQVFKARAACDGEVYALKAVQKRTLRWGPDPVHPTYDDILREVAVMRRLHHPFLVPLLASFQTPDRLFLVMPFCSGGEVFTLMKTLCWKEEPLRVHAAQLVLALDYLHGLGLVYGDMKPENLLLDRAGNCLLADFGLVMEAGTPRRDCPSGGTQAYMAPEDLRVAPDAVVGVAADWWGLGLVLYEMATGVHPFLRPDGSPNATAALHKAPDVLSHREGLSDAFLDLVLGFLEKRPADRLAGKVAISRHPFFDDLDWDLVLAKRVRPRFEGRDWGAIVAEMFEAEEERFDPVCSMMADSGEGPSGADVPGFEYVSEAFRSKLRR